MISRRMTTLVLGTALAVRATSAHAADEPQKDPKGFRGGTPGYHDDGSSGDEGNKKEKKAKKGKKAEGGEEKKAEEKK
jgi:hypothetical protein